MKRYDEAGAQILAFVTSTSGALAEDEVPTRTTPGLSLDCTLEIDAADVIPQNRSDPPLTIVSEGEIVLQSGLPGKRFEVESMGHSVSLVTEVNERAVVLTCFGELAPFDEIAVTLGAIK